MWAVHNGREQRAFLSFQVKGGLWPLPNWKDAFMRSLSSP